MLPPLANGQMPIILVVMPLSKKTELYNLKNILEKKRKFTN
jgi:hypothetical protein